MNNIRQWLDGLGLGQYAGMFEDNCLEFDQLADLTNEFLKDLGVQAAGHRMRILKAAGQLQVAAPSPAPPRPAQPPPGGEAQRRQLTVMFADLAGSTELSRRLDPEDVRDINRAYQDAAKEAIEAYGGYVARYMGDGVLAYFGYPQAHEDDAERGVRASLSLIESMSRIDVSTPLSVRIGIATGPVVVGDLIGEGASQESAVVGETPNLAARLQSIARHDCVVIAPATWQLTGEVFECEDLGEHAINGFDEPVRVRRVLGERTATARFETAVDHLAPLVGRDAELVLLEKRWRQAVEGQGQVVVITGAPGIGKSRLLREFQASLGRQPRNRVLYYCSAHHQQSAFYPAIDQLRRVLSLESGDTDQTSLEKLENTLALLGLDVAESAPPLAGLLSLPLPRERHAQPEIDPMQRRERLLHTFIAIFERMASHAPLMLVVEDVHWSDPSTAELLRIAVEQLRSTRALLVVTARPEFEPGWRNQANVTLLSMNHLTPRDSLSIVTRMLQARTLPDSMLEQITARAEGVPLYVEELTKAVLEAGPEAAAEGIDGAAASGVAATIPASLHDSLMARLDRLGPAKELAQLAATLGRSFSHGLLEAVWPHEPQRLEQALDILVESDLLQRRGRGQDATYMFRHALLKDAAYQALLNSTRRRYHALIAEVIVERFPGIAESEPETVAQHFTEALRAEAAIPYWYRAGRHAWDRSAGVEAISHLNRGLELIGTLEPTPALERLELELRVMLGAALGTRMGWAAPAVEQNYLRAEALCDSTGDESRRFAIVWGLWLFAQWAGQMSRARQLTESVLNLAEIQRVPEYRLQARHAAWTTAVRLADFGAAQRHAEQGIALYDPGEHAHHAIIYGGHDPGVCAHCNLALSLWAGGQPQQALDRVMQGERLAERLRHPFSQAMASFFSAHVHQLRGEQKLCHEQATRLVGLADAGGFSQFSAAGRILDAWARASLEDDDQGLTGLRDAISAYEGTGAHARGAYFLTLLAGCCLRAGRIDEARSAIDSAHEAVDDGGEWTYAVEVYRVYGEVLVASHELEQAEAWLEKSCALASEQGALGFELRAAISRAQLYRMQGLQRMARDRLASVYSRFREGLDTHDLREAEALIAALG